MMLIKSPEFEKMPTIEMSFHFPRKCEGSCKSENRMSNEMSSAKFVAQIEFQLLKFMRRDAVQIPNHGISVRKISGQVSKMAHVVCCA